MRCSIAILALLISLVGCTKEHPNPEQLDPIFKDLETRAAEHKKAHEEAKVNLEALREEEQKTAPNTIELKDVRREIAKTRKQILDNDQWARYYQIRAERRKIEGRIAYKKAFAKGEQWPPPGEYSDYLVNIRLRQAPLNWNARVPKLQDRLIKRADVTPQPQNQAE